MARVCELSGKSVQTGMHVSHSHIRTKRRFLPNLQKTHLLSDTLGQRFVLRVATSTLRDVERKDGFDNYLLQAKDSQLSPKARRIKAQIKKKQAGGATMPDVLSG